MPQKVDDDTRQELIRKFEMSKIPFEKPRDGDKKSEDVYAKAYQALVRIGEKPQIKGKYRGR